MANRSEEEHPTFNPYRFSVAVSLFVWSAVLFLAPEYAGIEGFWRWGIYAIGILSFLLGCAGFSVEVGGVYGGTENFLFVVYLSGLFALIAALHLATVYIPMWDWLVAVLRIASVILCLPLSILFFLGLVSILDVLPSPTNRTDAILTILALLGALLPIVVSIFGSP